MMKRLDIEEMQAYLNKWRNDSFRCKHLVDYFFGDPQTHKCKKLDENCNPWKCPDGAPGPRTCVSSCQHVIEVGSYVNKHTAIAYSKMFSCGNQNSEFYGMHFNRMKPICRLKAR